MNPINIIVVRVVVLVVVFYSFIGYGVYRFLEQLGTLS